MTSNKTKPISRPVLTNGGDKEGSIAWKPSLISLEIRDSAALRDGPFQSEWGSSPDLVLQSASPYFMCMHQCLNQFDSSLILKFLHESNLPNLASLSSPRKKQLTTTTPTHQFQKN